VAVVRSASAKRHQSSIPQGGCQKHDCPWGSSRGCRAPDAHHLWYFVASVEGSHRLVAASESVSFRVTSAS
jgi:hypothetical protein